MGEDNPVTFGRKTLIGLGLLSILSIVLAVYGWSHVEDVSFSDALYRGLKTVEMGEAYDHIRTEFAHVADARALLAIEVARWLGTMIKLFAIGYIVYRVFQESFIQIRVRWHNRHLVIVGDSLFGEKLAQIARIPVIHLRRDDDQLAAKAHAIRLPLRTHSADMVAEAGASRAALIIFATERDDRTLEMAMVTQGKYPKAQVCLRLNDPWLAKRIHQLEGAEKLRAFSEPDVAAHFVVHRHPPFLSAEEQAQAAIHILLVGDCDWLEAILSEVILSNCTLRFGKPIFSFICEIPEAFADRLRQRYPEIDAAADLHFFKAGRLSHIQGVEIDLAAISDIAPVTCAYVALDDRAQGLSTALTFLELARKAQAFSAPLFLLTDSVHGMARPAPGAHLGALKLVPFGAVEDMATASGLLALETQAAERQFHDAYMKIPGISGEAARPWEELKEEYRVSNRREVGHIFAKLFEAGCDIRPWMATHDIWLHMPAMAIGEDLYRTPDELERLAELEHLRWIADRRLGGWSFGQTRDNLRKFHPDMKPFDELDRATKDYDVEIIKRLNDQVLARGSDGINRP